MFRGFWLVVAVLSIMVAPNFSWAERSVLTSVTTSTEKEVYYYNPKDPTSQASFVYENSLLKEVQSGSYSLGVHSAGSSSIYTDQAGHTAQLIHDPDGKLKTVIVTYHPPTPATSRLSARIIRMDLIYDSSGNVIERHDSSDSGPSTVTVFNRDPNGRLAHMVMPDGTTYSFDRDSFGNTARVRKNSRGLPEETVWDASASPQAETLSWNNVAGAFVKLLDPLHYAAIVGGAIISTGAVEYAGYVTFTVGVTSGPVGWVILAPTGLLLMGTPGVIGYFLAEQLSLNGVLNGGSWIDWNPIYDGITDYFQYNEPVFPLDP